MLNQMLGFAEKGDAAFVVLSAAVGTGLLIRLLLGLIYGRYIHAMNEAGTTGVKWIVKMRERFREQYELGLQMRDLDAFVRKNVFQISFLRVFLITWEKLGTQAITVCAIASVTGALHVLFTEMNAVHIVSYLVCGLLGAGVLLLTESVADVQGKRYILLNSTRDYLGNIALPAILAELKRGELSNPVVNIKERTSNAESVRSDGERYCGGADTADEPELVGVLSAKSSMQTEKSEKSEKSEKNEKSEKKRFRLFGNKESRGERDKNEAMRLVREARAERSCRQEKIRRESGVKSGEIQPTVEDVNEILKEFLA